MSIIIVILVGILSTGCVLFSEKDFNIRAGKARIQDGAAAPRWRADCAAKGALQHDPGGRREPERPGWS